MGRVTIPQRNLTLDVEAGQPLMWELLRAGLPVASSCGGDAVCGKCRVTVVAGSELLTQIGADEASVIQRLGLEANERVSCQVALKAQTGPGAGPIETRESQDARSGGSESQGSAPGDQNQHVVTLATSYW
jgi:2Fe-2S ferredoxin